MKKITQPVFSDFACKPLKKMLAFTVFLLCLCSGISVYAQSPVYFVSQNFNPPNSWVQSSAASMGSIVGTSILTTAPNGPGNQYFRFFSATSGGTNFSPNGSSDIQLTSGVAATLQTNTGNQGKAYYMNISNSWATSKVVMKTVGSGTTAKVAAFEIQGTVRTVSSVSRTPTTPNQSQAAAVTATLDGALATGQGIWLRYTTNAFSSSTLVRMTGSGTSYSANIPAQAAGTVVSYYILSSGTQASIAHADADLMTININNNSGSNYSYTVAAAAAPPAQPSAITGSSTVCNGSTQVYSVTNDITATNYIWTLPSGWSGTSTTNSITVTASSNGGTISVVAHNAEGDSSPSSLAVSIGAATAITTHPSTAGQSICMGTTATTLNVVATGGSLTYQWYSNTVQSNSGGTLISGANAASYVPIYSGIPLYYYCVVVGSCAPTSVSSNPSGLITIGGLPNDLTATYTISNGANGGQGFGAWTYGVTGGSGGTFTTTGGNSNLTGAAWGIYANTNGVTLAGRPFATPMAIGNNVSFAFDNGEVDTGNKVGARLKNASNNVLMEFRFVGGDLEYSLYDGTSIINTGVTYTTSGLTNVSFAYTGVNTYAISITKAGVTTTITGRTFAAATGGQVPAIIEFFNNNAGNGGTKNCFFNGLSMGYPKIFSQPATSNQNICLNGAATALSVGAYGSNLGYQWYSNPGAVLLSGKTTSTFSPPTNVAGAKTYYCVVSYAGTCTTVTPIISGSSGTITVKSLPTATISAPSSVCQNGIIDVVLNGANGTAPYTFTYSVSYGLAPPGLNTVTTTSGSSVTVSIPVSQLGNYQIVLESVSDSTLPQCTNSSLVNNIVYVEAGLPTTYYADADADGYGDLNHPIVSCGSTPPVYAGNPAVLNTTDCDDTDTLKHQKFSFYIDMDSDGYGTGSLILVCASNEFTPPTNYADNASDCDDTDSRFYTTYPFYVDADNDSYGTGSLVQACAMDEFVPPLHYASNNADCDDTNAAKYTYFTFYVDADGDTYGTGNLVDVCAVDSLSPPTNYAMNNTDCDDANALKFQTYAYYVDVDGDGYGSTQTMMLCTVDAVSPPANYSTNNTDCDDHDGLKHTTFSFYEDQDQDGYGTGLPLLVCGENGSTAPEGYSLDGTDCDDNDDSVYRSTALYIDVDHDGYDAGLVSGPLCYGALPEGTSLTTLGSDCEDGDDNVYRNTPLYIDADTDGYDSGLVSGPLCYGAVPPNTSLTTLGTDCNDNSSSIYRSAELYVDADDDGYTVGVSSTICYGVNLPEGSSLTSAGEDCDDHDNSVHHGALLYADEDQDGYTVGSPVATCYGASLPTGTSLTSSGEDCDDTNNTIYRSASLYTDADQDGYTVGPSTVVCYGANLPTGKSLTSSGEDCDDANAAIYQFATFYIDADQDGYTVGTASVCSGLSTPLGYTASSLGVDCDDTNAAIYRSQLLYADVDQDGYDAGSTEICYGATVPTGKSLTTLGTDCDDTNHSIYRAALLYTDADGDGYDAGSSTVCYGATVPVGKSLTTLGSDCDDATAVSNVPYNLYADSDNDGFGSVYATAVCAPVSCSSNTIAVTFRVDMTGQSIASGGVHVAGNFATRGSTTITSDWAPDTPNSQLHAVGGNIYETTIVFPAASAGTSLEFKFLRNNGWSGGGNEYSEQNISGSCGASGNRLLNLPAKFLAFNTTYDQCPTSLQQFLCTNTDCNDSDAQLHDSFAFYVDADHDNYGTGASVMVCALNAASPPTGYSVNNTDCNDSNILVYRTADVYTDGDVDGYTIGAATNVCYGATLPVGTSLTSTVEDCNDSNALVYRSANLYTDADADGYTVGAASMVCYGATLPSGTSLTSLGEDCDDTNAANYSTFLFYVDADSDGYGTGNAVNLCNANATPPPGYSSNDGDCDDNESTKWQLATFYVDNDGDGYTAGTASVCSGLTSPDGYSDTSAGTDCDDNVFSATNECGGATVVNLKLFVQGYYDELTGAMRSVKLNQDFVSPSDQVADMVVELYDPTTITPVASTTATLLIDGTLQASFASAPSGNYYLSVKGPNLIQTWTAAPIMVGSTPLTYDFSSSAEQAYGSNMAEVSAGVWGFFSGDLDANGNIDTADYTLWETDYNNFAFGQYITDLDGNGNVDTADYTIWELNYNNFVFSYGPQPE